MNLGINYNIKYKGMMETENRSIQYGFIGL